MGKRKKKRGKIRKRLSIEHCGEELGQKMRDFLQNSQLAIIGLELGIS
jgi:hypothetical protein